MSRRALVVATGAPVDGIVRAARPDDLVICADGGVDAAIAAGVQPVLVVGDLDSATAGALTRAEAAGARIDRRPADKDESDLELALGAAVDAEVEAVHVVLADGGRLDHQLANLLVLASVRWASASVEGTVGATSVWVVRHRLVLPLPVGTRVALQAVGGPAEGVLSEGLRFGLAGDRLDPLEARGIANEVVAVPASVEVAGGVLLAMAPSPDPPVQPDQAV